MLISGRSNNLNYYNLVRSDSKFEKRLTGRTRNGKLYCRESWITPSSWGTCAPPDDVGSRPDQREILRPTHPPTKGKNLARISHVFLFFWCFLGAYLGLKIDAKRGASGPNRLEIRFPFDLNLWHRFSNRF